MVNDIAVQDFVNAIKEEPTDSNTTYNATVSRVDKEGIVWVNIHGSDKETPTASTSTEVKRGDTVTVNWRNNKLYIGGNYSNPSAGIGTVQPSIDFVSELYNKDITVNSINAATGYIEDLTSKNIKAEDISADHAMIRELDVESMAAAVAYIGDLTAENIEAEDIIADHATIDDLDVNYAQINAANVTDLSAQNAWVNKIMVQTGLLAHEGTVFTLDAIQVNAANITAGTIDVNRLIVTVDGEKYLVEIDPTTHQPSYEKLDGGIVEPRTITADKIVAHDITVQEITTGNLVGTNGWINLNQGKFFYTTNGSTWANTTNGIMWDGTSLKIKGDVNITAGNVYTKTESDSALSGKVGNNEVITKINASSEGVQIQAAKVDIAGAAVFNNYSTTTQMNTAIGNAVDGIEVGGRNLSLKTDTAQTLALSSGNYWFTPSFYSTTAYGKTLLADTSNTRFTVSYDYSITGVTGSGGTLRTGLQYTSGGSYSTGTIISGDELVAPAGDSSGHISITFEPHNGSRTYGSAWMILSNNAEKDAFTNASLTITNFKFEIGTKATDWTPAPEDVQAEIDAKKSVHTLTSWYLSTGASYATILGYAKEGQSTTFSVNDYSSENVKIGDSVRIAYAVSDMGTEGNRPIVYINGTVTAMNDARTSVTITGHGLDTTIIDGGNILTNSIGANQIAANAITADKIAGNSITASKIRIGDFNNYVTVTENDASSLIDTGTEIVDGWVHKKNDAGNTWLSPELNNWTTSDEVYRVTGKVKTPAAGRVNIYICGRDAGGVSQATATHTSVSTAANTETAINTTITITDAVANQPHSNIFVYFYTGSSGSTTQQGYFKDLKVERIAGLGDNLLIGSQKMDGWVRSSNATIDTSGDLGDITLTGNSSNWLGGVVASPTLRPSILNGTSLWLSLEYKASVASTLHIEFSGSSLAPDSRHTGGQTKYKTWNFSVPAASSWAKLAYAMPKTVSELTGGSGDINSLFVSFYNRTNSSTMHIRKVKLEYGLGATDWTPSPEDQKAMITRIDDNGIRIHPSSTENNSVVINSSGMEVFKGGTGSANSVAFYGDTARVGASSASRIEISPNGLDVYGKNDYGAWKCAEIGVANGTSTSGSTYNPYYTFGYRNGTKGNFSMTVGATPTASGYSSFAQGESTASGNKAASVNVATASGYSSFAGGTGTASADYSVCFGDGTQANGNSQMAIGKYNVADTTSLFIIGNGYAGARSNALAVSSGGELNTASAHKVGGYKLITTGSVSKAGSAISGGSYGEVTVSATKTGYTPIGIIGYTITGTNAQNIVPYQMYLNGTTATAKLRNVGSNSYTPTVTFYVLYIASGQGI